MKHRDPSKFNVLQNFLFTSLNALAELVRNVPGEIIQMETRIEDYRLI